MAGLLEIVESDVLTPEALALIAASAAEEAALCTYICPSKTDFDVLLREGLDLYEREA